MWFCDNKRHIYRIFQSVFDTPCNGNCRGERIKRVTKERVIWGDKAPFVLADVVYFTRHIIVTANDVYLVLEEEGLVGHSKLVHRVKRSPSLALHIEQVHFSISIGVFAADKDDFRRGDRQGRARPERVLHANSENDPSVFVDIIHFYGVINLLLGAAEKSSKGVNELIINSASTQVMSFVFHDGHLGPFVLFNLISFDRVKALLAAEAAQHVDVGAAHGDSMRVPTLVHGALVRDLVPDCQVEAGVFLRWRSTSSY